MQPMKSSLEEPPEEEPTAGTKACPNDPFPNVLRAPHCDERKRRLGASEAKRAARGRMCSAYPSHLPLGHGHRRPVVVALRR